MRSKQIEQPSVVGSISYRIYEHTFSSVPFCWTSSLRFYTQFHNKLVFIKVLISLTRSCMYFTWLRQAEFCCLRSTNSKIGKVVAAGIHQWSCRKRHGTQHTVGYTWQIIAYCIVASYREKKLQIRHLAYSMLEINITYQESSLLI